MIFKFKHNNTNMSIPSSKTLLSIFSPSEIFHSIIDDTSVLFRFIYKSSSLNFLLYDYKSMYYCSHSNDEILSITKSLNPSLEYDSLLSLVILLKDNLVSSDGLSITKSTNDNKTIFTFESLVNILSIKYKFECEIIDDSDLVQSLFAKPMNNIMLAISKMISTQVIKVSDMEKMVSSDQMKKTKGFDKEMKTITKISSMSVNDIKEDITAIPTNEVSNNIVKKKQSKKRNYEKAKFIVDDEEAKSEESNKESLKDQKKEEEINEEKKKTKKKKKMKFI